MSVDVTRELLDRIARLPLRDRAAAHASLGKQEHERCTADPIYWLDAVQHAIGYVHTKDPHPMYRCRLCDASDPTNLHTFDKQAVHLELRHGVTDFETIDPVSQYDEMPSRRVFTLHGYMRPIIQHWLRRPLFAVEKSRDMMMTWLFIALFTWDAMFHRGRQNIIQSDDSTKTNELILRAKYIVDEQPAWLRAQVGKAAYTIGSARSGQLRFVKMESEILGFPQGPQQIRQYHPSGVFMDEAAFQTEAHAAFAAIKPAIQHGGRVSMVSTANPSFFMHVCRDTLEQMTE